MTYTNVRLLGATTVREEVITISQETAWEFTGWRGGPIVYSDSGSIFIYDLSRLALHCFMNDNYLAHEMTRVEAAGQPCNRQLKIWIKLSNSRDMVNVKHLPVKLCDHILDLVKEDDETTARLLTAGR